MKLNAVLSIGILILCSNISAQNDAVGKVETEERGSKLQFISTSHGDVSQVGVNVEGYPAVYFRANGKPYIWVVGEGGVQIRMEDLFIVADRLSIASKVTFNFSNEADPKPGLHYWELGGVKHTRVKGLIIYK